MCRQPLTMGEPDFDTNRFLCRLQERVKKEEEVLEQQGFQEEEEDEVITRSSTLFDNERLEDRGSVVLHGLKLCNFLPGVEGGWGCLQEEESEYETDSEEEQLDQQRLKPLFVKREEREVRAWQH